jgi:hypothetical protein
MTIEAGAPATSAGRATPSATSIRDGALSYLTRLRLAPFAYRMTDSLGASLFTACFAYFVRHLLHDRVTGEDADALATAIDAGQDAVTGSWKAGGAGFHPDHTRAHVDWQLSTFAMSALAALGRPPAHPLRFLEPFRTPEAVRAYLDGLAWERNPWNSGNRALFLGALLSCAAGPQGDGSSGAAVEAWFEWHDRHARPSGFWGEGHRSDWYVGMGGAAHQYLVYHFHRREPPHLRAAVDRVLRMQYPDGRFWPVPGGGSCYELDALEILVVGRAWSDHRRDEIAEAARRATDVVLASQNADGGFCWAARRWFDLPDAVGAVAGPGDLRTRLWTLRALANAHLLRREEARRTAWVAGAHPVGVSSVYDTWFRLLTLATASRLASDPRTSGVPWTAVPAPNWGYF